MTFRTYFQGSQNWNTQLLFLYITLRTNAVNGCICKSQGCLVIEVYCYIIKVERMTFQIVRVILLCLETGIGLEETMSFTGNNLTGLYLYDELSVWWDISTERSIIKVSWSLLPRAEHLSLNNGRQI